MYVRKLSSFEGRAWGPRILGALEVEGKMVIGGGTTATEQRLQQDIEQCKGYKATKLTALKGIQDNRLQH